MTLKGDGDLARLEQRLSDCIGRRVGRDLLRLELNGQLGWSAHQTLQNRLEDLQQQLLHLRLRGELHRLPTTHERDQFLDGLESPWSVRSREISKRSSGKPSIPSPSRR